MTKPIQFSIKIPFSGFYESSHDEKEGALGTYEALPIRCDKTIEMNLKA